MRAKPKRLKWWRSGPSVTFTSIAPATKSALLLSLPPTATYADLIRLQTRVATRNWRIRKRAASSQR